MNISLNMNLLDRPSNMEIELSHYQIKDGKLWTYDLTYHLLVELKTIIVSDTMAYIFKTNLYELHPMSSTSVQ